ncbi:30S ribosomal protein S4 [Candidatus Uhrbacteria bacterium CG_4_9_14_3_um_filter_50_9]|uniref:Small ribosomal subunit protein uS4 n=1 Tax=Candidatus Uhrbacteria bacterium CG_4_9_14_3_um_filter_50_9 TaxID=1975035 RepID=A0A2M7XE79_9BACT|nr:MAG: 30S ribosomal protein S4 [Candidatus Uhrbacteria bacterium CG_4_9_14_3_um_filter_50_9]
MAKNNTPIVKLSRRLGIAIGKENYTRRRPYPPGIHGPKQAQRRPRMSAYGEQLLEKQKAKAIYGIMERQFRNYFEKASKQEENTAEVLVRLLEQRLDNVVFRLGFAKTRRQARQVVGHGFILVNGNRVDIPSFSVSVGDEISIKESKKTTNMIKQIPEVMGLSAVPKWIARDDKALSGKVTSLPEGDDLDQPFDPTLIVEFYSR